jgi:hypothetical protein
MLSGIGQDKKRELDGLLHQLVRGDARVVRLED